MKKILFLILFTVPVFGQNLNFKSIQTEIQIADSLFKIGNYKKAFDIYLKNGINGESKSQFKLSQMLDNGIGVVKDSLLAFSYLEKSAYQGYADAQLSLGNKYFYGQIVKKNIPKAIDLYNSAANKGQEEALLNLGILYWQGWEGITPNPELAVSFISKASDKDNSQAMAYMASFYTSGFGGLEKNFDAAFRLAKRAVFRDKDNADAHLLLGKMYLHGVGTEQDILKAYNFFGIAANLGDKEAIDIIKNIKVKSSKN